MPGPGTPESNAQTPDAALRALARRLALARLALAWEATWRAAWPLALLAGLFLVVAFLDVLPLLAPWLHASALAAVALAGLAGARVARRGKRAMGEARRRLEAPLGVLRGGPAKPALRDRIAGGADDALAAALWQAHRRRVA
ncbi:MAG: DUF4175 family protein, partial [Alphaproteobacteria bacterium]